MDARDLPHDKSSQACLATLSNRKNKSGAFNSPYDPSKELSCSYCVLHK